MKFSDYFAFLYTVCRKPHTRSSALSMVVYQESVLTVLVLVVGLEPTKSSLQVRRSTCWSYTSTRLTLYKQRCITIVVCRSWL